MSASDISQTDRYQECRNNRDCDFPALPFRYNQAVIASVKTIGSDTVRPIHGEAIHTDNKMYYHFWNRLKKMVSDPAILHYNGLQASWKKAI